MQKESTVFFGVSKNKRYFRTCVPRDVGINLLGLRTDVNGQRLTWRIESGKVVVSGVMP